MNELLSFLKSQRLLAIASADSEPWICNVYYIIEEDFKIYFISSADTKHSRQMLANPVVAFSVAWFNPENHEDRKAVQGRGVCRIAKSEEEIKRGVELHNIHFPEFKGRITEEYIKDDTNPSKVWVIEPSYMKFWNDELYEDDGLKEFNF